MSNIMNKMARNISENVANQIQEKMTTKYEWHAFSCQSNHEFAIKISVDVSLMHITNVYHSIRCPICESKTIKKQPNL